MKIVLLGATGSIGMSACNCIRRFPEKFEAVGLSSYNNAGKLMELVREFRPVSVCIGNSQSSAQGLAEIPSTIKIYSGQKGLENMVNEADFDVLLNAVVGAVGLRATVAALKRNKRVALANKESLVIGGEYIYGLINRGFGEIIPVDSEHSAILQCLSGENKTSVESIILTASGGPFRETDKEKLRNITPEQALDHPTWSMGKKITIDSATLMNKGFEVIEAHHLFGMPYDKIRVLIHPQSIIHSMVEYFDGAVIAQMGVPDMELPIQFALSYPDRLPIQRRRLDLVKTGALSFFEPDYNRFPCLKLCLDAGRKGGTSPTIVNAANEMAVQLFLSGKIRYDQIAEIIEDSLGSHPSVPVDSLETIENIDSIIRMKIMKRFG
jgi:1-deoxy-D-xylulose 5-phosphate reductoisomerase